MSAEQKLRQYFSLFDGYETDFSEVEPFFEAAFHDEFTWHKDGNTLTRDAVKARNAELLSKGAKVTLIHVRRIGFECLDVKFRVEIPEHVCLKCRRLANDCDEDIYSAGDYYCLSCWEEYESTLDMPQEEEEDEEELANIQEESEREDMIINVVYSVEDNKLAMAQEVDSFKSIIKARCSSDFRLFNVMGKYQTNM